MTQMQKDLAMRSPDLVWPADFTPESADWFIHNSLVINAPAEHVWNRFIDVLRWPSWYALAKDVEIDDGTELAPDTTFRWKTFGLSVHGRIDQHEKHRRISWHGYAPGNSPTLYHNWYFAPAGEAATVVVYDEVGNGALARRMRATDEAEGHRGHELMLHGLRYVSETGMTDRW